MPASSRIIVGVSGSPGSLAALRCAEDIARVRGAELIPVIAWVPPGGEGAELRQPSGQLRRVWRDGASHRLSEAMQAVWGTEPHDLTVCPHVERGPAGWVLVNLAGQPGDMLVLGAGRRGAIARAVRSKVSRYCAAHARCPVVLVPPPELARDMRWFRLAWVFRRRNLTPEDVLRRGGTQAGGGQVRA